MQIKNKKNTLVVYWGSCVNRGKRVWTLNTFETGNIKEDCKWQGYQIAPALSLIKPLSCAGGCFLIKSTWRVHSLHAWCVLLCVCVCACKPTNSECVDVGVCLCRCVLIPVTSSPPKQAQFTIIMGLLYAHTHTRWCNPHTPYVCGT